MATSIYPRATTAVLCIDTFNDFISEGGKLWPYLKENAERVDLLANLKKLLAKARAAGLPVVFVPHHRHDAGDYEQFRFSNPTHAKMAQLQPFERGSWGAQFHPEFAPQAGELVVQEHWMHSGFANTDLDYQLRMRGIDHIVLCGLRTNACFEATARHGVELGYHVTLLADATAAFRRDEMDATLLANAPYFAHGVMDTTAFIAALDA